MTRAESNKLHEYLSTLSFIEQIKYLIKRFPQKYNRVICSSKSKDLFKWINEQTPLLNNQFYKLKTKVYWILHNIKDFPKCANCNHIFDKINVKTTLGYPKFCKKCNNLVISDRTKHTKETCLKKYGYISNMSTDVFKKQRTVFYKYEYDNQKFSSTWEIAYYMKLKADKINFVFQPKDKAIEYFDENNKRHLYFPDFYLIDENQLVEIKGNNHFDKYGNPIKYGKYNWKCKYDCMIQHNVRILTWKDIETFYRYYGGYKFFKQFIVKKTINAK